jgi:hypothetical protein
MVRDVPALFRASGSPAPEVLKPASTLRPPSNVPYLVDNLWEWSRPPEFPSRRSACFASATAEAALNSQNPAQESFVHRLVGLPPDWLIAQHAFEDAKFDLDVRGLQAYVRQALSWEWFGKSIDQKQPEALLFCPTLAGDEVQRTIEYSEFLDADELKARVTFWTRVKLLRFGTDQLSLKGEVFFSIPREGISFESVHP